MQLWQSQMQGSDIVRKFLFGSLVPPGIFFFIFTRNPRGSNPGAHVETCCITHIPTVVMDVSGSCSSVEILYKWNPIQYKSVELCGSHMVHTFILSQAVSDSWNWKKSRFIKLTHSHSRIKHRGKGCNLQSLQGGKRGSPWWVPICDQHGMVKKTRLGIWNMRHIMWHMPCC